MTNSKQATTVLASGLELTFEQCTYRIGEDGYLYIEKVSGPQGKVKTIVSVFNEWTMVCEGIKPKGLEEQEDD